MRFVQMSRVITLIALCLLGIRYAAAPASSAPAANPFFAESALQYHAPPFDKIKDSDYTPAIEEGDRKSTRLNSSHANISYAVLCLKKTEKHTNPVPSAINGHALSRRA